MVLAQLDFHIQKNEVEFLPHTYTKTSSKWTKDINVTAQTIKLLEENIGLNLCDLRFWQWFLRYNTKSTSDKRKKKLDFIKIKTFCASKDTIKKVKRQITEHEKIFINHTSDKGLVSRIKTIKTHTTQWKKWEKDESEHFFKENIQMANKHMKWYSTSLVIR